MSESSTLRPRQYDTWQAMRMQLSDHTANATEVSWTPHHSNEYMHVTSHSTCATGLETPDRERMHCHCECSHKHQCLRFHSLSQLGSMLSSCHSGILPDSEPGTMLTN